MSQPPAYPGGPGDPRAGGQGPGGYQPPPPSYGTPPAPPGYGAPAPAPGYGQPPAGYPQPPGGAAPFSIGEAFNWAWNKFTKNATPLIVSMLIYAAAIAVLGIILWMISAAVGLALIGGTAGTTTPTHTYGGDYTAPDTSGAAGIGFFGSLLVAGLMAFVFMVVVLYIQSAYLKGCLEIADGRPVTIGSFLEPPRNLGSVILAALLVAIATVVGSMLCVVPGILVAFFTMFTLPFVIDRGLPAVDAIKASVNTIRQGFWNAVLAYVVTYFVVAIGAAACYFGLLVSAPVGLLIQIWTYRRLSGGQIAPLTVDGSTQPYQQQPYQQPPQQPYQQPPQQPPYQPPSPYQG